MQNTKIKLKSKVLLAGMNSRAVLLLVMAMLVSVFLGSLPAAAKLLLDAGFIHERLVSVRNWLPAAVSLLMAVLLLISAVLLLSPFRLGREAWFLVGAMGKKKRNTRIAFWFKPKRAFKAAGLFIILRLLKTGWQIVFISPGAALLGGAVYMMLNGGIEMNVFTVMVTGGALAVLTGLFFSLITVQRYFLTGFLLAKEPGIKIKDAVRGSTALMEGRCFKTALFKISFAPWFSICSLLLPLAYVWPYYKQACACLGLYLIKEKAKPAVTTEAGNTMVIELPGEASAENPVTAD